MQQLCRVECALGHTPVPLYLADRLVARADSTRSPRRMGRPGLEGTV